MPSVCPPGDGDGAPAGRGGGGRQVFQEQTAAATVTDEDLRRK